MNSAPISSELASLLADLPATSSDAAQPVFEKLVRAGPATVSQLVAAVGQQFGDPQGVQPSYAVHGLVHYASRPGAGAQRKMVAAALAKELEAKHSVDLKSFICQQLQLCGGADEVPALAKLLADESLCEPATQTLSAIGGDEAAAVLREALPAAKGKRRTTIINALGRFRDKTLAAEVRKSMADGSADLRVAAWYALGNMGDAAAADALLKAASGEPGYERNLAFDACLRLARRLGESGDMAGAEKLLRQLADCRKAKDEIHDRCAVLETLGAVLGAKATADMMTALASDDSKYRTAAARIALDLARTIQKSQPAEAEKLAGKILEATQEEVVRRAAAAMSGKRS